MPPPPPKVDAVYYNGSQAPDYRLMSVNRSYTVRSVYLQPREPIPFPGTNHYPSYDYSSHPEYPLYVKDEPKEILIDEDVPLVLEEGGALRSIEDACEDANKILFRSPLTDVAHFETVASEPPLDDSPLESLEEKKMLLPAPIKRVINHSTDGLTSKPDKVAEHILKILDDTGDTGNVAGVEPLNLGSHVNNPNHTYYVPPSFENVEQPFNNNPSNVGGGGGYFVPNPQEIAYFNSTTLRKQQMTITHSNTFYQFPIKSPPLLSSSTSSASTSSLSRPPDKNSLPVVSPPTSSSLGLTQMKALYDEMHRKRTKEPKKKSNASFGSSSSNFNARLANLQRPRAATTKKARTIFSDSQSADMLRVFRQTPYISAKQRYQLAQRLEIPEETISVWFKNQRSKLKKKMSPYASSTSTSSVDT